jgi:hypothetical protein
MTTLDSLRHHLDTISASTATAAEALGDGALDLPLGVLAVPAENAILAGAGQAE